MKIFNAEKLIIKAALTGMIPTKKQTSYVPITPEEIFQDACKAIECGASVLHIYMPEIKMENQLIRQVLLRKFLI